MSDFDWQELLLCPTCKAKKGEACKALYAFVVDGYPGGGARLLDRPHAHRKPSRRR